MPRKKGKPSWKPARKLDVRNKQEGYHYRWIARDAENIDRRMAEGYVFANKETGIHGEHVRPRDVVDGKELEGVNTYRDVVLMATPDETKKARDEYYQRQAAKQMGAVHRNARGELAKVGAPSHGDGLRIEKKGHIETIK